MARQRTRRRWILEVKRGQAEERGRDEQWQGLRQTQGVQSRALPTMWG